MNFFEHQMDARRLTRRLVAMFVIATILIIVTLSLIILLIIDSSIIQGDWRSAGASNLFTYVFSTHGFTLFIIAAVTIGVIGGTSAVQTLSLRQGGDKVAQWVGARQINHDCTDLKERRLLNIVEEMMIAAGTARPGVYVMDNEPGINAFAAGYTANNAIVAVTRGALDNLTRDELQGVIAHEFSHILNGDMRMNIRMLGVLSGILLIGNIGLFLLRSSQHTRSDRDNRAMFAIMAFGFTLAVVGYIGVFFGRLIRAGVSRQREFLADASSVQFTRNPFGIADALQRIRVFGLHSQISSAHAEKMSHMFFGAGFKVRLFSGLLASHPPLEERITRIQPGYNFAKVLASDEEKSPLAENNTAPLPEAVLPKGQAPEQLTQLMQMVGGLLPQHIAFAQKLHASFPPSIQEALAMSIGPRALLYALLMDKNKDVRIRQTKIIQDRDPNSVVDLANKLYQDLAQMDGRTYFPLREIAVAEIKSRTPNDRESILKCTRELIMADARVSVDEYIFMLAVEPELSPESMQVQRQKYNHLSDCTDAVKAFLALMAITGQTVQQAQQQAYEKGLSAVGFVSQKLPASESMGYETLIDALRQTRALAPKARELLIQGLVTVVMADGTASMHELELLRVLAKALECPIPAFV